MHSQRLSSTVVRASSETASSSKTEPEAATTAAKEDAPGSAATAAAGVDKKSSEYSETMSRRMGTSLTYRHEAGLDFNRILPDLIVGSCLQTAADVDRLAEEEGVTTIFCLQEDSDMAYFNLDIEPIKARCKERGDIKHVRFPIRDFDPFDLRRRLPKAVTRLAREHRPGKGAAYIHCTAGMGRAPGTALAYMNWVRGMQLDEAYQLLTSLRTCSPKVEAIRAATVDLLLNVKPVEAEIAVWRLGTATKFEIAGLDVGWHQRLELQPEGPRRVLRRPLLPGRYQWKLIVDDHWTASMDHPTMQDGTNTNNFIHVADKPLDPVHQEMQSRLLSKGTDLTQDEREELLAMLCPWDTHSGPREVRLPDVLASIGEDPRLP